MNDYETQSRPEVIEALSKLPTAPPREPWRLPAAPQPEKVGLTDGLCRIRTKSIMGWPAWVTNVSEPVDTGEGMSPIVSMSNKESKAKYYTREEAEKLLPDVCKVRPGAEIVE